jgi:uncharacterized protein YbbC (DUF1343 family)
MDGFNGRYFLVSRSGIVYVIATQGVGKIDDVVPVFHKDEEYHKGNDMKQLSDVGICKHIAIILRYKPRFTSHPVDMIQIQVDGDWKEFNPLKTENDLIPKLKEKFKVNIETISKGGAIIAYRGVICNWVSKPEYIRSIDCKTVEKAILLAIINANDEPS